MTLARRYFLKLMTVICAGFSIGRSKGATGDRVTFGAIRWDAWYTDLDESARAQRNLSVSEFKERAPSHCADDHGVLRCDGSTAVLDAEIRSAAAGGLTYWAFVWTPEESGLHRAFELYESSPLKNLIKWCAITSLGNFGSKPYSADQTRKKIESFARRFSQDNYQTVVSGRPLLFLNWYESEVGSHFSGETELVADMIRALREQTRRIRGKEPYIVIMAGDPKRSAMLCRNLGGDAISNYIPGFRPGNKSSYLDLASQAEAYWGSMAETGVKVIVDAIIGWDTRPRLREKGASLVRYYKMSTPVEFFRHLKNAILFIDRNASVCEARTILVYSWNECDEGGCMLPTLGDRSAGHLRALAQAADRN